MGFKLFCGVIGFICGLLLTKLLIIDSPFKASELMIEFILNPLLFFAVMVCFLIGFVANSVLVKEAIQQTYSFFCKQNFSMVNLLVSYCVIIINFVVLFQLGFWQTLVLSCFTIIYGIISIEFKSNTVYERDR